MYYYEINAPYFEDSESYTVAHEEKFTQSEFDIMMDEVIIKAVKYNIEEGNRVYTWYSICEYCVNLLVSDYGFKKEGNTQFYYNGPNGIQIFDSIFNYKPLIDAGYNYNFEYKECYRGTCPNRCMVLGRIENEPVVYNVIDNKIILKCNVCKLEFEYKEKNYV